MAQSGMKTEMTSYILTINLHTCTKVVWENYRTVLTVTVPFNKYAQDIEAPKSVLWGILLFAVRLCTCIQFVHSALWPCVRTTLRWSRCITNSSNVTAYKFWMNFDKCATQSLEVLHRAFDKHSLGLNTGFWVPRMFHTRSSVFSRWRAHRAISHLKARKYGNISWAYTYESSGKNSSAVPHARN